MAPAANKVTEREALEEAITLLTHYGKLLNMHDGGHRLPFMSADEWIKRLQKLRDQKA